MTDSHAPVTEISAAEVKKAMDGKEPCVLLDVRTPMEYSRSRLEGSINVPVDEIEDSVESAIPDKNATVYVYCLSGSRSVFAAMDMVHLGYTNVFNMTHGLLEWRVNKFPEIK